VNAEPVRVIVQLVPPLLSDVLARALVADGSVAVVPAGEPADVALVADGAEPPDPEPPAVIFVPEPRSGPGRIVRGGAERQVPVEGLADLRAAIASAASGSAAPDHSSDSTSI
jgi:hypothetical protein